MGPLVEEVSLGGWYVGYAIAAVVIVLVVALLARLLALVRRIAVLAPEISDALDEISVGTRAIPKVAVLNDKLGSVCDRAAKARAVLGG